jgi:hypothetical protein
VFALQAIELLTDAGECIDPQICYYRSTGRKLNAYDYLEDSDAFDLFVADFDNRSGIHPINSNDVALALRRCRRLLGECLTGKVHSELEESTEIYDLAELLYRRRGNIRSARIFLLTNRRAPVEVFDDETERGVRISHYVWDIERLYQAVSRREGRAQITVDFEQDFGGGIPCLSTDDAIDEYTAYLALIPGDTLARVYERWGQRLLERNVRSFLQARGSVNRGIRDTLSREPHRFLAYNNGISATADAVTIKQDGGVPKIAFAKNLQIVNGGQTTASMYEALRRRVDLSGVYVQMKLTVLQNPELVDELVPLISQYANSQTKVSLSDFSANHPFHIELEKISRLEWAPNPDARARATTRWYYERARGQYQDDYARQNTVRERAAWKLQHPKSQLMTKTDVARYEMTWHQMPHVVSRGSEKNFSAFCAWLMRNEALKVDVTYFQHLVAKAILFRECDRIVRRLDFGGYKANVNAYTIAWLSRLSEKRLDLDSIWAEQAISPRTSELIQILAPEVWEHITNPPDTIRNVTEWCKREACWNALKDRPLPSRTRPDTPPTASMGQPVPIRPDVGAGWAAAAAADGSIPPRIWQSVAVWGRRTGKLRAEDCGLADFLANAAGAGDKPTLRQTDAGLRIYANAIAKGYQPPSELGH